MTKFTWEVTATRRDGTRLKRYKFTTEEPVLGAVFEDESGLRAIITAPLTFHAPREGQVGLGIFQVTAEELD